MHLCASSLSEVGAYAFVCVLEKNGRDLCIYGCVPKTGGACAWKCSLS